MENTYLLLLALMSLCLMTHNLMDASIKWDPTKSFWDSGKSELVLAIIWCFSSISWFIRFITLMIKG